MKNQKYLNFNVVITQDEDGIYVADCPAIPGCHGQVFDVLGSYVILFEKDVEVTTKLVGHELGHVVLHLAEMSKLSRYSQWERRVMRSFLQDGRKRIGDTPQENAEADYFSEYWNRKLDGVDWLRGTVIEDLDDL
ncbi:type II toxin-antitoxin system HicB family antitoxin [Candidatus Woesearchaeota archaeon]|nr:type II toxin-antitoxin system HicB family antitoxin [Candidatus Woesearchaeota archaeon]